MNSTDTSAQLCAVSPESHANSAALQHEAGLNGEHLSNDVFIKTIFGPIPYRAGEYFHYPLVRVKNTKTHVEASGWQQGDVYGRASLPAWTADVNNYITNCTFKSVASDSLESSSRHFGELRFLVLNDVGKRIGLERITLSPSWEIETSPGNSQMGFILDTPIKKWSDAEDFVDRVSAAGLCEERLNKPVIWFRLPEGVNSKDTATNEDGTFHRCRLLQWHPENRYSAKQIKVTLLAKPKEVQAAPIPVNEPALTLIHSEYKDAGLTVHAASPFEGKSDVAVEPIGPVHNALARYSLTDSLENLEKNQIEKRLIFGDLVYFGQATVFYAKPNTGKTLITLRLAIDGIKAGRFDPRQLNYINMDDDLDGLIQKTRIAKQYGFQMLSTGYNGFEFHSYLASLKDMTVNNTAKGVIVVVDTLTKIVDTMDKKGSREFAKVVRDFVLKGGTFLGLGHANKKPGPDGKIVYAGTSDIVDNFDCIWTIEEFAERLEKDEKTVIFENRKDRGGFLPKVAYSYSVEPGNTYEEKLTSVHAVSADECDSLRQVVALIPDAAVIAAIEECIREGRTQKMLLGDAASERANVSGRQAMRVLEKYTGDDPAQHRWNARRGERGMYIFRLLEQEADPAQSQPLLKAA